MALDKTLSLDNRNKEEGLGVFQSLFKNINVKQKLNFNFNDK